MLRYLDESNHDEGYCAGRANLLCIAQLPDGQCFIVLLEAVQTAGSPAPTGRNITLKVRMRTRALSFRWAQNFLRAGGMEKLDITSANILCDHAVPLHGLADGLKVTMPNWLIDDRFSASEALVCLEAA
jgi:hypothetical protein